MDGKRSREESLVYILLEPTAFFRTLSPLTQRHTEKYVFSLSLFFESLILLHLVHSSKIDLSPTKEG